MTRDQFKAFVRALVATLLAGLVLWVFHQLGVNVTLPTVLPTAP
jgi:hypothetical protein